MDKFINQITSAEAESSIDNAKALTTVDYAEQMPAIYNQPITYQYNFSKGSKKKHKKKNKSKNRFEVYPSQESVLNLISDANRKRALRNQMFYPTPLLRANIRKDSFFLFGKSPYGDFIGKKEGEDGNIAVFGPSGSGKTTSILLPSAYT